MDEDLTAIYALQLIYGARQHMILVDTKLTEATSDEQRQTILSDLGSHVASLKGAFIQLEANNWTYEELKARYTAMINEVSTMLFRYDELPILIQTARSDLRQLPAVRTKMEEIRIPLQPVTRG